MAIVSDASSFVPDAQDRPRGEDSLDERVEGLPARARRLLRDARAALERQQPQESERLLERARGLASGHAEFLRLLGITRQLQGRAPDAVAVLKLALQQWPDDALILTNLGTALRANGEHDAAIAMLQHACRVAPALAAAWYNLGRALGHAQRVDEAQAAYAQALVIEPGHANARISLGDTLRTTGRIDEAVAEYRRVVERTQSVRAWGRLANVKTVSFDEGDAACLQARIADRDLRDDERVTLGFALGKALEDVDRHADAFEAFARANALKRSQMAWDAGAFSAAVDAIMRAFSSPPDAATDARLGDGLVFVVSLPRSGSTLAEQILAAHPLVQGGDERTDLDAVLDAESQRRGMRFPDWVAEATPADWSRLGHAYLGRTARARKASAHFTDKGLSNWRLVGAVMAMLPGAHVVSCRRDAIETCLSCWRQQFARGHAYTYDLADVARFWLDHDRLMRFWHARYPQRIHDLVLERLLADGDAEIRRLLAFCGLPFDAACLRFHEASRPVRTISAAQVRQPLQASAHRAASYGDLLAPLRSALDVHG